MVFKPLSHLARRSSKAFAHHAQSITAASSTTTSQHLDKYTNNRFRKPGSLQHRDSFHSAAFQQSTGSKGSVHSFSFDYNNDSGLDAYFAAWQRAQHGDEWQQFQFRKRIEWKNTGSTGDTSQNVDQKDIELDSSDRENSPCFDRANSASVVEGISTRRDFVDVGELTENERLAAVDQAIALEIQDFNHSLKEQERSIALPTSDAPADGLSLEPVTPSSDQLFSPSPNPKQSNRCAVKSNQSSRIDEVVELERNFKFDLIPAAFEALLKDGLTPTIEAYNSLILAAIHLPKNQYQVIPKVLDVYSDLLRRKVRPNQQTYTLLLDSLSIRARQVVESQRAFKTRKLRLGMESADNYMFRSHSTEFEILSEDDSFAVALKIFDMATKDDPKLIFNSGTYKALIEACAAHTDVDSMIMIHAHMELNRVTPYGSIYPAMINAFASAGEMRNAVECYEAYKQMAVADDCGTFSMLDRVDNEVYSAVIKGYLVNGRKNGADSFLAKLNSTESVSDIQLSRLRGAHDAAIYDGYIKYYIQKQDFEKALGYVESLSVISSSLKDAALCDICINAADNNASTAAILSHGRITDPYVSASASIALLAMYIRQENALAARSVWSTSVINTTPSGALIEPVTMYAIALSGSGLIDEGIAEACRVFRGARKASQGSSEEQDICEKIDEAIDAISQSLRVQGIVLPAQSSMDLMWSMIDNGGLLPSIAEQLLSGLGPNDIASLSWRDLNLALQVEAGIVNNRKIHLDIGHHARFTHLLEVAFTNNVPLDERTSDLVQQCLKGLANERPELIDRWNAYKSGLNPIETSPAFQGSSSHVSSLAFNDSFDPHSTTLDARGSALIIEELDRQASNTSASLSEALARFRNIRRAGRHPRYIVYAKLISAAAKDGRASLIYDLIGMAERDLPLLLEYPVVRHGWASIFDAMVGACLTLGNRRLAGEYHQHLRDIGCAPTANTFGLYITTLKESTRTFDEASEAVKIFQQAKSEGVEPSSFLYNALIGKLGKARRIDDCLFYFAEMRSRNIRPTSVTYGTIVNALCRVSDERFAQELFDEMESMPNYKPRPAPYNSLMQFFLTTKRDSAKVLEYYQRMQRRNIQPTMHTYKLLIDTYATLEPVNLDAAEGVLDTIRATGQLPEAIHYASLVHAKGCVLHDMVGARKVFDDVMRNQSIRPHACLYQALFESMVANHCVSETECILSQMHSKGIEMTPYIANTLIHGWALVNDVAKASSIYDAVGKERREPSTYEAMTRAFLSVSDRDKASEVVREMLSRGYPSAVSGKILELLSHGTANPSPLL